MSTCECDYPNISVSWSRKSSNCTGYNWSNSDAECQCKCKSTKGAVAPDKYWGDIGNCGWDGWSGDDEEACKSHCNTKCSQQSTSVSGKPLCAEISGVGTTWNGSFCEAIGGYQKGGIIKPKSYQQGGTTAIPVSKNINEGASTEVNPNIVLPTNNFNLDISEQEQKVQKIKQRLRRGGRTRPITKNRRRGRR
jgi:hypothetical protein